MKCIIGIDPGWTGAAAVLKVEGNLPFFSHFHDCSEDIIQNDLFISGYRLDDCHACLELVHSMPGQGVSSTFKFGKNFGMWEALLVSHGIKYTKVTPQAWKKHFGLGKDKTEAIQVACLAYPEAAPQLVRKKDHNRAEALLLAHYYWKVIHVPSM